MVSQHVSESLLVSGRFLCLCSTVPKLWHDCFSPFYHQVVIGCSSVQVWFGLVIKITHDFADKGFSSFFCFPPEFAPFSLHSGVESEPSIVNIYILLRSLKHTWKCFHFDFHCLEPVSLCSNPKTSFSCSAYLLVLKAFIASCPLCLFLSIFLFSLISYPIPLFFLILFFSSVYLALLSMLLDPIVNPTYGPLLCSVDIGTEWLYLSHQSTSVMIRFCETLLVTLTTVIFPFSMLCFTSRG